MRVWFLPRIYGDPSIRPLARLELGYAGRGLLGMHLLLGGSLSKDFVRPDYIVKVYEDASFTSGLQVRGRRLPAAHRSARLDVVTLFARWDSGRTSSSPRDGSGRRAASSSPRARCSSALRTTSSSPSVSSYGVSHTA